LDYGLHDFIGNLGVITVLVSYLLVQLRRIEATGFGYSVANAVGAALILYSLYFDFNLSAVVIEAVWLLISLYGLWRFARAGATES